jgi:hypothetical protein
VRRFRLTLGEWLLLGLLAAWSLLPLAAGVVHLIADGDVLAGTDGIGQTDHYQYLAWVREAGEHVLISNRFDLAAEDRVYLQPMWVASGLAWAIGLPVQAAFLLWKPVAVIALFAGCVAYVRRTLETRLERLAALALALLYFPPTTALLGRTGLGNDVQDGLGYLFTFQLTPATYLWGYVQTAIAVGLMPVFFLALERAREGSRGGSAAAAAAGLAVSWVHPWQGLVLIAVGGALALWERRPATYALPLLATAAPIAYFALLSRTNRSWEEGGGELAASHQWGWLLLALAPLTVVALAGIRRPLDLQDRVLILWPLATLAIYAALDRTFFFNTLSGLSIPLAVLAVRGAKRIRLPAAAASAAVAVAILPGIADMAAFLRDDIRDSDIPRYLTPGEAEALEFLDDHPREGGVLARVYLGQAVPGHSGRHTYVGHPSWTPDYQRRIEETEELFTRGVTARAARAMLRKSGAEFVLEDCAEPRAPGLDATLAPLARRMHRFGCATVWELK